MSEGCTNCGRKGGCDHRKGAMFAAIETALGQLYPTRRFEERAEHWIDGADETAGAGRANPAGRCAALAAALSKRLGTLVIELPPALEEYCRHIYLLCLGRSPSLIEAREGLVPPGDVELGTFPGQRAEDESAIEELYLRVSVSDLVPFAAVQQVRVRGHRVGDLLVIEEAPRAGVFDPVLLPRMQATVAVIVEQGLRNLDFGEINEPPVGFDPGDYGARFGGVPVVANYFFYPQPCSSITTTVVPGSVRMSFADPLAITRGDAAGVS